MLRKCNPSGRVKFQSSLCAFHTLNSTDASYSFTLFHFLYRRVMLSYAVLGSMGFTVQVSAFFNRIIESWPFSIFCATFRRGSYSSEKTEGVLVVRSFSPESFFKHFLEVFGHWHPFLLGNFLRALFMPVVYWMALFGLSTMDCGSRKSLATLLRTSFLSVLPVRSIFSSNGRFIANFAMLIVAKGSRSSTFKWLQILESLSRLSSYIPMISLKIAFCALSLPPS